MKVLLTGAGGKLGSDICRALFRSGFELVPTDLAGHRDLPVPLQEANLLDYKQCRELLVGVDAIIHLAAYPNDIPGIPPQVILNENIAMTVNILQACREAGIGKFLYASSVQAMAYRRYWDESGRLTPSRLDYLPADGKMAPHASSPYGFSKQTCEQLLQFYSREYGIDAIAFRFPKLVGESESDIFQRFHDWLASSGQAGSGAGIIEECFSWLSIRDAGRLMVDVLNSRLPGYRCYFPVASSPLVDIPISDMLAKYFANVELRTSPDDMVHLVDISVITAETGWRPLDDIPARSGRDNGKKNG